MYVLIGKDGQTEKVLAVSKDRKKLQEEIMRRKPEAKKLDENNYEVQVDAFMQKKVLTYQIREYRVD